MKPSYAQKKAKQNRETANRRKKRTPRTKTEDERPLKRNYARRTAKKGATSFRGGGKKYRRRDVSLRKTRRWTRLAAGWPEASVIARGRRVRGGVDPPQRNNSGDANKGVEAGRKSEIRIGSTVNPARTIAASKANGM